MTEINKVKVQNFIETQIPEFLNEDNPLFKEFLNQYYISLEHQTGTIDLANNFLEYKKLEYFNNETFYSQNNPCILESDLQIISTTVQTNHTIGFPSEYGLLKIGNEILTYTSKTDTTFEGCIRGFSAIDEISNKNFYFHLNFSKTSADSHNSGDIIENLNLLFFNELFRKFKYQFLPGFENRNFTEGIDLQNILSRAKDFYASKGTDTSYKLLFKILFNEEIEVIKPQDYMLRPSDNKYFITKNILVEKIYGNLDPLTLKGETLYQETEDGIASGSIYNVEFRPVNNKFLYEISLDPDTLLLKFISTKKTSVVETLNVNESILSVDSTVGFPISGVLVVQSVNSPSAFTISYEDKTLNQFLNLSGNTIQILKNDTIIESNFSYVSKSGEFAYFRIINVIEDVDYSDTSNLRVDDIINLSSFGLELNDYPQYNSWIYNIPTSHRIHTINATASQNIWRIELVDGVTFTLGENIVLSNLDINGIEEYHTTVRRIVNDNTIEVNGDENILDKNLLSKTLSKSNVFNYPDTNTLTSNIQNTYIDDSKQYYYVASSGLPDYTILADDREVLVTTQNNPDPFSGIGGTTTLNSNKNHRFYTGERVYYTPQNNLGISTGVYFASTIGNFDDSSQLSLSYSNSDVFSQKYIEIPYSSSGFIVKVDYENKLLEHQKLLRKFNFNTESYIGQNISNSTSTNNKPVGLLVNGVELYSYTLYDENIYYGKIDNILITNFGNGYDIINSPELEISDIANDIGYGYNAKSHVNLKGTVKGIKIINPGSGYDRNIKISIYGGNGYGASLEANVIKTRIQSGFRGDGTGINPTANSIRFVFPHNFEDGEVVEYFSNGNIEIEYFDPVSEEIRKLPSNSFYFVGIESDTILKLYRTKEDAAKKINEINLTTSPSFGFHYLRSLESKYSISNVYVKNEGFEYSNKKIIISSQSDNNRLQNGVNITDNYIFAKNHNFNNKDLVIYKTTGNTISGLSTEFNYFVQVLDKDRFSLSFAGEGRNIVEDNFSNKKYVRLNSVGSGSHTFTFPPIELDIQANPESANGKLTLPILEPIVLGNVESLFLEDGGENYGSNNIINFHRRPNVFIKQIRSEAILKPIIIDGSIIEVQILNYGRGYNKDIDLIITGSGNFADLYPVITDGRVTSIIVINGGVGYSETTSIRVVKRGNDAKFLANVFEWKIDQVKKNEFILDNIDEGILVPSKNQQNGLQFIHFYPPRELRKKLGDNIDSQNTEELSPNLSPILGWSYDGFPIYGPYSQTDNEIKLTISSYRQQVERNQKLRPSGNNFPDGFFTQDYIFDIEYGDGLDEHNGKYIKNNQFPDGTYAYFFTVNIDNRGFSVPQYPYIISTEFKRPPELENFNPAFNQNLDLSELNLIRNVSPYYLNSNSSFYDLIDDVEDKYKQEFNVRSISNSGITNVDVYFSGDNYEVGDLVQFDNSGTNGYGANAVVSSVKGKPISSFNVGITTINPTYFSKIGRTISASSDNPIDFIDGEYVNITSIDSKNLSSIPTSLTSNIGLDITGSIVPVITTYNNLTVRGSLYYPTSNFIGSTVDVIVLYHPSIDSSGATPASSALNFLNIVTNTSQINIRDKIIFSVEYPQDAIPDWISDNLLISQQFPELLGNYGGDYNNFLLGDNIEYAEAALLWVKNNLNTYMSSNGIPKTINKVFTFGHSQGAYLVHRLNTMHVVDGVISNAPGPIDLLNRCSGTQNTTNVTCNKIRVSLGSTTANPGAYNTRSLKNYLSGTLSSVLFTQALDDTTGNSSGSPQVANMQTIVQPGLESCVSCASVEFRYYDTGGHPAFVTNVELQEDIRKFLNSGIISNTVTDNSQYKFLEGIKKVSIINKTVGLSTDILNLASTGNITKIYPNNIIGFNIGDYIQIEEESLKIIGILPQKSEFTVERLSNTGFHTATSSEIKLLPKKFEFIDNSSNIPLLENKIVYFNPEEVISVGENPSEYNIPGISSITIPEKSIYIPNHSFTTGQPLLYNSGVDGSPITVYNYPGDSNFQLNDNQIVYVVNVGKDFLGISTLGFTTNIGIGTENNSLYFDSGVSGIGIAHSFTTNYTKIIGNVENYSIDITTLFPHELKPGDIINLNIVPQESEIIKFRYDPIIRKITTELIDFNSNTANIQTSEIDINTNNLKTGDKIVYYSNNNPAISGLIDNEVYFVIIDNPEKIKFSRYYSDAIDGIYVDIRSIGSGTHSIAKINPKLSITKGNNIIFDTLDDSLIGLTLRLYKDFEFKTELETYTYVSTTNERYLRTSTVDYPRELYYSFCSFSTPICPDYEVKDNNFIEIVGSGYITDYEIIGITSENSFKINLQKKPENLSYTKETLKEIEYTTRTNNVRGPIAKIQLNSGGKSYKKVPKISNIISNAGKNAVLKARSNTIGRISSVDRIKDGFDYPTDFTLLPLLSVPAVVQVEDISRVDYIGIITGGKNYNSAPFLKVIGNDRIKLQSIVQGSSVVDVNIIENTDDLSGPLRVLPIRNSNGYSIDDISVNGDTVTLELLNSDNQVYPLITTGYGSTEFIYPFSVGDEILIERCRISEDFVEQSETSTKKDNFNSSTYDYRFFTVTGISTENYTVTYSMTGVKDNLDLGEYTSDFGYGYVVNRRDMAEFEMFIINDLSYASAETVLGYNERGVNTFNAKVMKNGWDNDINELRLIEVLGELNIGDKLKGQTSLLNGTVTSVNKFNLKTKVGVTRDKLNDLGDRVGFTNDHYQRISDNRYYQKFSYSIRGKVPYVKWKEPVKSLVHPSGFREFSDLSIASFSPATMKVGTASSLDLLINIDNVQSTYTRNNFAMVTEDEQFEDGSIERIIFEEGVALRPYILSKSNKVTLIDDISANFNGTAILEIIANKDVTFISTDIYKLGVSTEGLSVGDKIGVSTYHFYPDSTFIFGIGNSYIQLSEDTPHKLFSINGISTSVSQNLNFYRRIPGCKVIGDTEFKLTNNQFPIFYREFDASNGITTTINLQNNTFILQNHNFQTGQKLKYTPETQAITAIAATTIGSGAVFRPIFDENYSVKNIKIINGGTGYNTINPPKIQILGTQNPLAIGTFTTLVEAGTGIITSVSIGNSGFGYFPISLGTIGIGTTSDVEGRRDIIIEVGGGTGGAIYERGFNVAITTTVSGVSSSITPNFSGQQNRFWGFFDPYIPAKSSSGGGIDAKFSIFIVYNSTTGQPISTSIVLRDGGRGYAVGDNVSIAGSFMGGSTPTNDLSFVVSKVSSTRISLDANSEYFNIPANATVGYGTGARLNIERDNLGDISKVVVVNGGDNYSLTDNISIAGTYIGGITPQDNLFLSPVILGIDKLPTNLYVEKITNTSFQVAGTPTGNILDLTTLGVGTHSIEVIDQNANSIISIDNIIQSPIYRKTLSLDLTQNIDYNDTIIYLQDSANELTINDILKINEELIKIKNIGIYGENSLIVERGVLGTEIDVHSTIDPVYVVSGNYNIIKDSIYFSSAPYGPIGIPGLEINSSFSGRTFSRRSDPFYNNDNDIIFDDISDQFTGIAATQFILKSNGNVVSGIFTDTNSISGSSAGVDINNNPIILINNIPQIGGLDYIIDTPGQNTIKFVSGVPLAGKITVVGINTGFGYLPLVGASASVTVSPSGQISNIKLTGFGQGYRQPPAISIESRVGSGASVSATIGVAGTITTLTVVNAGSGYTSTFLPDVRIDPPQNYYNLNLMYADGYTGSGQGAKGSIIVGNGSSVISFTLDDPGISYNVGDVLVASGIMTNPKASYFEEFRVEVIETFTDSFGGWYPGQFIQFDDLSDFFNGFKKKFTLTITISGAKEVLSLKTQDPQDISITNNIFVFVNDVLQVPNESYTFTGSRIVFKEAPKRGSKCNILFFRGSDLDVEQVDPPRTIKEGDEVQIDENIYDPYDRPQFSRVVKNIVATDILDTFPYDSLGISSDPNKIRPLNWTKQTLDRIMNGVLYSKSRPDLTSKVTPTAYIIKDISRTDTSIYVDSAIPLFEDIDETRTFSEDLRDIMIVNNREIEAPIVSANVSSGTTISSIDILSSGLGYINIKNPLISISNKYLTKKDPIYNWSNNVGFVTNFNFNSIGNDTNFVSVGSSGYYSFSNSGENWSAPNQITNEYDFNSIIGNGNVYIAVGQTGSVYKSIGIKSNSAWERLQLLNLTQDILGRVVISLSNYDGDFNKVAYSQLKNTLLIVGDNGKIFNGVGIDTNKVYENTVSFSNLNSIAFDPFYFIAVGNTGDIVYSQNGTNWEIVSNKLTLQNLNDVIWDGQKFIVVGNNGTILTSTDGLEWINISNPQFTKNIISINYDGEIYTILDNLGKLYYSLNLLEWTNKTINNSVKVNEIYIIGNTDNNKKYVSVGSSGFISYSTPVFNPAVAICTTINEKLNQVTIVNGGFGYSPDNNTPVIVETDPCEKEQIFSIKAKGDFGTITKLNVYSTGNLGFGTTSPAIEFTLKSGNYDQNILPNMQYTPISIGDYFTITNSNVICGHALTGITTSLGGMSNYPNSIVGTATTFIDGIYKVESSTISSLGISTVRCIFTPIPAVGADNISINVGINTTGFYGRYSFGIIYDYQNRARENPKRFVVNKNNGLSGISTGPIIYRTRSVN